MKSVTVFDPSVGGPNLEFIYNGLGQRIGKIEKPRVLSAGVGSSFVVAPKSNWVYTYYALDASGNTLATYTQKHNDLDQIVEVRLDELLI